jgi:hypothetical protein
MGFPAYLGSYLTSCMGKVISVAASRPRVEIFHTKLFITKTGEEEKCLLLKMYIFLERHLALKSLIILMGEKNKQPSIYLDMDKCIYVPEIM